MDPLRLYHHPISATHDMGPDHPEQPGRYHSVVKALSAAQFSDLPWHEASPAQVEHLTTIHPSDHIQHVLNSVPKTGISLLGGDPDVRLSPTSGEAALHAAGGVIQAIDDIMAQKTRRAFCIARPPGHHAEPDQAMGFCFFNNVAIGAAHAASCHKIERLAIVDFDVHHGNGTQAACWNKRDWFFASSHQWPLYPGTGRADEQGAYDNIRNILFSPGSSGKSVVEAWREGIIPLLDQFKPQLLIISAGFDAHRADPLGSLDLVAEDFAEITRLLSALADRHAQGRILSALEGGYDLAALGQSAAAHVQALLPSSVTE